MCISEVKNRTPLDPTNQVLATRKWLLITIIKNQLQRTNYESGVIKNRLQDWHYQKAVTKEWLPKTVRKWPLPKIECQRTVTIETIEIITIVFNNYQKMVKIVSNGHKQQTILTVTKSPYGLWTFFYLTTTTVPIIPTRFFVSLCHQYCQVFISSSIQPISSFVVCAIFGHN
jgi:hypothetical protein